MILEFHSGAVTAKLESSQNVLVSDVAFQLKAGECLALIGETGSGKTMTAMTLMGLLPGNVSAADIKSFLPHCAVMIQMEKRPVIAHKPQMEVIQFRIPGWQLPFVDYTLFDSQRSRTKRPCVWPERYFHSFCIPGRWTAREYEYLASFPDTVSDC